MEYSKLSGKELVEKINCFIIERRVRIRGMHESLIGQELMTAKECKELVEKIEQLIACRDHWKTSYEHLTREKDEAIKKIKDIFILARDRTLPTQPLSKAPDDYILKEILSIIREGNSIALIITGAQINDSDLQAKKAAKK
jgi:hypothetical protein